MTFETLAQQGWEVQGSITIDRKKYTTVLRGKICNRRGKTYEYAQLSIALQNAAGMLLGQAVDTVTDWEADTVWSFAAVALLDWKEQQEIVGFTVEEIFCG